MHGTGTRFIDTNTDTKYFYYKLLIYSVNMNSNELSRREFLKRILALSAAAAMPTILTKNTLTAARPKPRIVRTNGSIWPVAESGIRDSSTSANSTKRGKQIS